MQLTDKQMMYSRLFNRHTFEKAVRISASSGRFVHYTSADTAFKIIDGGFVWMRNAMTMNDFSEVSYGADCVIPACQDEEVGGKLRRFLDDIHPEFSHKLAERLDGWLPHFEQNTYLTSLSEHDLSEDRFGRLSMWRAYAPKNGVALVMNNTPFMGESEGLNAYSSSVSYVTMDEFKSEFSASIDEIIASKSIIMSMPEDELMGMVFNMLKMAILCTKHPGFKEEREWRIVYSPTQEISKVIEPGFATVEGIPQEIHKIPLIHAPDRGLNHADIPTLLDRIIIGPTEQPRTMYQTFVKLLAAKGVVDAETKVIVSDIPLRVG